VRWKAKGALKISLYQDGVLIPGEFRPSDEYEVTVSKATVFRVLADYGNEETAEKETQVVFSTSSGVKEKEDSSYTVDGAGKTGSIFDYQPPVIELDGTVNAVFTGLLDQCSDRRVKEIESLEISVAQLTDYRKLGTTIPLLNRFGIQIDQTVSIQTGDQFVRLEYQGSVKGFQSFFTTINGLLNNQDAQADVNLKLSIEFKPSIQPQGSELSAIKQALARNPVDRLYLSVRVTY
jgi:hypothetical protein